MRTRELIGLLRATALEWWNDDVFRLSASLAFYTIFSMAPISLIAVGVASALFGEVAATRHLVNQIAALTGTEGGQALRQVMERVQSTPDSPTAALTGLFFLVLGSTAVFADLQSSLNRIWDVQAVPTRGLLRGLVRDRLLSFAIVLGVGFLLLVSLVLSAMLAALQELLENRYRDLPELWRVANMLTSFLIACLLFAMIYKVLPDVRLAWRDVAVGAVVTAALFSIGKSLIGMYLGQMAFASRFGAAGSFVVLLIWVYYSALICFFGAEFTQVFARRFGSGIRPQAHATRVGNKPDRA